MDLLYCCASQLSEGYTLILKRMVNLILQNQTQGWERHFTQKTMTNSNIENGGKASS